MKNTKRKSTLLKGGHQRTVSSELELNFCQIDHDDLAGLHYYEYQVFDLGHDGTSLIDGQNVALGTEKIEITDSSVGIFISFNL